MSAAAELRACERGAPHSAVNQTSAPTLKRRLVGRLSSSQKTVYDVREYVQQRCKDVGDEAAARELVGELQKAVKELGESRPAGSDAVQPESIREAVLYALHEVLTKVVQEGPLATRLLPDIETLASRCVDHFLRTIVKMRDSSGAMEHHQIKSAENLLKVLRTWRLKWSSFNESEIIRNCIKTLKNVAQRGDKSGNGDEKPKSKRPPRDRRPEAPPSARGDSPEAPLVPMPMGLSSLIPGGAPSIARPSSLDGAALPRVMPLPPKPKTDWGQSRPAESPGAASPAGARAARRLDAGGAKRFDVCRLLSDVCDALRHSRGTKSTAFYFLHYFLQHAASEPPEHAPLAVNKARHAAEMARYGKAAESSKAQLLAREAYVATLDDDELVALALAATHLAGKATDTPQRLSYILDAVRAPQGSAAKRRWPAAAPHREQVLLAEVRLLRCICFDTRTVDSETALGDFCETLDDFEYVSKWRARLNTAAPPPPPKKGGEDDLAIAKKMFHAALDVSASLAFHASGLVTEHRPEALMAACVLCASKTATWSDDAQSEKIGLPQDWLDSAAKKCGTHAAQLRGIASEVETTGDDLQEYFGFAKELPSAAVVRQLRCDAAKRAAQATLKRLCDEALPRYVARVTAESHTKVRPSTKPQLELMHRLHQVDDCGIALYYSDHNDLLDLQRKLGRDLPLLVERSDEFSFRFGAKAIFASSSELEPSADLGTRFRPLLHVCWPRADIDAAQICDRAKDAAHRATAALVEALRRHADRPPAPNGAPPAMSPMSPHSKSLRAVGGQPAHFAWDMAINPDAHNAAAPPRLPPPPAPPPARTPPEVVSAESSSSSAAHAFDSRRTDDSAPARPSDQEDRGRRRDTEDRARSASSRRAPSEDSVPRRKSTSISIPRRESTDEEAREERRHRDRSTPRSLSSSRDRDASRSRKRRRSAERSRDPKRRAKSPKRRSGDKYRPSNRRGRSDSERRSRRRRDERDERDDRERDKYRDKADKPEKADRDKSRRRHRSASYE